VATGLSGAAYTNNDLNSNTTTSLFDIDTTLDQVALQSPPNAGSLAATGKPGIDGGAQVGFDIYSLIGNGRTRSNLGGAFSSCITLRCDQCLTCLTHTCPFR